MSEALRSARRIVVKVGSSLVTNEGRGVDAQASSALRVGSKRFTEAYILAELIAQTAQRLVAVVPGAGGGLEAQEDLHTPSSRGSHSDSAGM